MIKHLEKSNTLTYEQAARYRALVNLALNNASFVLHSVYNKDLDSWSITTNNHIHMDEYEVELSVKHIPSALVLLCQEEHDEDYLSRVKEPIKERIFNGLYSVTDAIGFLEICLYGSTELDDFYDHITF